MLGGGGNFDGGVARAFLLGRYRFGLLVQECLGAHLVGFDALVVVLREQSITVGIQHHQRFYERNKNLCVVVEAVVLVVYILFRMRRVVAIVE